MEILDDDSKHISQEDAIEIGRLQANATILTHQIRNARRALLVLILFTLLGIAIGYQLNAEYALIEGAILIGAYGFAVWYADQKPVVAIGIGAVLFALWIMLSTINDPGSFLKGVILKGAVGYYLVVGIKAGQEWEKLKEKLQAYGQEIKTPGIFW